MSKDPALTVLAAALNEAESLKSLLPPLKAELATLGTSHEILIVDGGSTDATVAVATEHGCRVLQQNNPGFGGAIRDGFSQARGEFILELDADGSHPPAMIPKLWQARRQADVVIASRFIPGGSSEISARNALSWILNTISRWWLAWPIKDASSGLRIYRAAALHGRNLAAVDFTIQQETLAAILGAGGTVAEIPFHYGPRVGGHSKARVLPLGLSYLRMFWRLRHR